MLVTMALAWALCFALGWGISAAFHALIPYGFDQRWRPDRMHVYSSAALRFSFKHPARLAVFDTTPTGSRTGIQLRLRVQSPSDAEDGLIIRVRDSGIPPTWGRRETEALLVDVSRQMAKAMQQEYAGIDGVRCVRQRASATGLIGGAPTLHWTADLSTSTDGSLRLDQWECYAPGGKRFTAVCITRPDHGARRRELARVVRSMTFGGLWPVPDGAVWVVHPSLAGTILSTSAAL